MQDQRQSQNHPPGSTHAFRASGYPNQAATQDQRQSQNHPPGITHAFRASICPNQAATQDQRQSRNHPPGITHAFRASICPNQAAMQDQRQLRDHPPGSTHAFRASGYPNQAATQDQRQSRNHPPGSKHAFRASICPNQAATQDQCQSRYHPPGSTHAFRASICPNQAAMQDQRQSHDHPPGSTHAFRAKEAPINSSSPVHVSLCFFLWLFLPSASWPFSQGNQVLLAGDKQPVKVRQPPCGLMRKPHTHPHVLLEPGGNFEEADTLQQQQARAGAEVKTACTVEAGATLRWSFMGSRAGQGQGLRQLRARYKGQQHFINSVRDKALQVFIRGPGKGRLPIHACKPSPDQLRCAPLQICLLLFYFFFFHASLSVLNFTQKCLSIVLKWDKQTHKTRYNNSATDSWCSNRVMTFLQGTLPIETAVTLLKSATQTRAIQRPPPHT
eukprot:1156297-Pelagomonas_calceolata.AAC.7